MYRSPDHSRIRQPPEPGELTSALRWLMEEGKSPHLLPIFLWIFPIRTEASTRAKARRTRTIDNVVTNNRRTVTPSPIVQKCAQLLANR